MKTSVATYEVDLKTYEERYQAIKDHAGKKLEEYGRLLITYCHLISFSIRANTEIAKVRAVHARQLLGIESNLRMSEMKVEGLQAELERKAQENVELGKMCEECITQLQQPI